jgi:molybdopterin converting factor subunit 1
MPVLSAVPLTIRPMRLRVLFFGMLKDLAGKSDEWLELPEGAMVRDVLAHFAAQSPSWKVSLLASAVAVNQEYAGAETVLRSGDEVGLLPPVSGGAGDAEGEAPLRQAQGKLSGQPAGRRRHSERSSACFSVRYSSVVRGPIDTAGVLRGIKHGEDGAVVLFEGVVRNQTRGRRTLYLDYEAYEEMALRQMEQLAEQALREFQVRDIALVHRLGRLEIGETSVLIVVASAHRAAAFESCRWLIDTLKRTVPIWKKEYFEDGAVWADGEAFPEEILGGQGSPGAEDASK